MSTERESTGEGMFLEDARLGARHPVLLQYAEAGRMHHMRPYFRAYALVDLAHGVMLVEEGILDGVRGGKLLGGLLEILEAGPDRFPWEVQSGSYLVHVENYLGRRLGHDVAGRLQTGRSRNDQGAAVDRLFSRDLLLEVFGDLLALARVLLSLAREHVHTVMPGYTHLQHAQPWTFGFYLMRQVSILERDLQRLAGAYARANLSALGGAACAGTSWPVNRRRVAELLGHDGLVTNACDAGSFARDHLEEEMAVLALLMSNLGRLATDLYVWHSWEFSFVEVADGLAATSSIMPQKKNPRALETVKALAGQAAGWLPAAMACQRGVLSTDLDMPFGRDLLAPAGDVCTSSLRLMTEAMRTLTVYADAMAQKAGVFWSTASHLADELVRRFDLPFRTAHQIVGRFIKGSIAAGHTPQSPSADLFRQAAQEMAGRDIALSAEEIRRLLDVREFLETCATEGSVNPRHVRAHIEAMDGVLAGHERWHAQKAQSARQAVEMLVTRAKQVAVETPGA
ncbi:MAG: argininosuccinate lyase [Armatimonadetes bacterium]|nr:argininosuccinate lyase [Armatimonadota bacterium]